MHSLSGTRASISQRSTGIEKRNALPLGVTSRQKPSEATAHLPVGGINGGRGAASRVGVRWRPQLSAVTCRLLTGSTQCWPSALATDRPTDPLQRGLRCRRMIAAPSSLPPAGHKCINKYNRSHTGLYGLRYSAPTVVSCWSVFMCTPSFQRFEQQIAKKKAK